MPFVQKLIEDTVEIWELFDILEGINARFEQTKSKYLSKQEIGYFVTT